MYSVLYVPLDLVLKLFACRVVVLLGMHTVCRFSHSDTPVGHVRELVQWMFFWCLVHIVGQRGVDVPTCWVIDELD